MVGVRFVHIAMDHRISMFVCKSPCCRFMLFFFVLFTRFDVVDEGMLK